MSIEDERVESVVSLMPSDSDAGSISGTSSVRDTYETSEKSYDGQNRHNTRKHNHFANMVRMTDEK